MCKQYICIDDYQNGDFHIGDTKTAEEWREWAMQMNDYDEFDDEMKQAIKSRQGDDLVQLIADIWQIEIVEFDKNNAEHIAEQKRWLEID